MKRLFSIVLACLLVLGVFSACSKQESGEESRSLKITYDAHYENMSESSVRAYTALCEAVMNGEEEAAFGHTMTDDVNTLYYTSFPLSALVSELHQTEDTNGFKIVYANDADAHKELVEEFSKKVFEIQDACGLGSVSNDRFVFNLYTYICENVTFDDTVLAPYETIMNGSGSLQSISQAFEYILCQSGIKASHITNFDSGVNVLSAVYFSNAWYLFCPALEIKNTEGKGLEYFAMSFERASTTLGVDTLTYSDLTEVDPTYFAETEYDKLESATSYTDDSGDIVAECSDGQFTLPLK